jgi:transcriptional regulator with XRE-family HTH domain
VPNDEPDAKLNFRKTLRWWRERKGVSQEDLAYLVGKTQQWVWKVEAGTQSVKLEDGQALADALGVPFRLLIFGDERVAHDLDLSPREIGRETKDALAKAKAAERRSKELGETRVRLQAELDAALVEQNRAELERGYHMQRWADLSRLLGRIRLGE